MQVRGTSIYKPVKTRTERVASVAIVAALHVAAIAALVIGLNVKFAKFIPVDTVTQVLPPDRPKPADPPPPRVHFDTPSKPTAPEPVIDVDKARPSPIHVTSIGPANGPFVRTTRVAAITDTHSKPPYPPLSRRLGHEGMVLLKLTISPLGIITAVDIERSSGYADLDRTAAQWVRTHWRYRPATVAGHPVTSTAEASVRFSLKDSD